MCGGRLFRNLPVDVWYRKPPTPTNLKSRNSPRHRELVEGSLGDPQALGDLGDRQDAASVVGRGHVTLFSTECERAG